MSFEAGSELLVICGDVFKEDDVDVDDEDEGDDDDDDDDDEDGGEGKGKGIGAGNANVLPGGKACGKRAFIWSACCCCIALNESSVNEPVNAL